MKKVLSLLLVCCMLLGALPFSASAETTTPTSQAYSVKVVFWVQEETTYPYKSTTVEVKIDTSTNTATVPIPDYVPIFTANVMMGDLLFYNWVIDEKWAQGSEIYYTDNNTLIIQNPIPGYTYELAPAWLGLLREVNAPAFTITSPSYENAVIYHNGGIIKMSSPSFPHTSSTEVQVGDTVVFEAVPDEGYHVRSFSVINNKYETLDLEIKELGNNKYSFVQPDDVVIIGVDFSKNGSTPEEPGDEPVEDTPSEDVPSDNNQTIVENLPNGYTSTKIVAPQGDVLLTITNSAGDSLANIYIPSVLGDAKDFVDNRSGWFKEAVDKASALGLFAGTSDSEFSPNMPMTRAMLVTVLHNLSSKPYYGNSYFNDVPSGSWYESAVDWAWTLGITAGTGSGFSPSDNITREQLVTMLYHYAELIGVNSDNRASLSGFSDSGDVSSYAYDAMRWAVAEGFVNGMGDGTLAPKGNATRAQVASILTKFVESIAGRDVTDPPAVPLSTQNGYYICPICKFVNEEGTSCIACSTINQAKPEEYCPTCGGGYDVGGVVPWVYCYYCKDYFSGPEGPYYNCRRCGKSGLRPSDLDPESELCADCFDPNPQYCTECGRSSNVVIITRYGYCEDCYQKNHAGEFGYCEVCGIPLSAAQSVMYNGKRCFSCCVCKYCGTYIMEEEYDRHGEFICDACSKLPRVYCAECGADITGQHSFDGLCGKCWSSHPNVYCPNCGYGMFVTGVGIDGLYCPKCGHNWLP